MLNRPVPVGKHGNFDALCGGADDGKVLRAHHKIHVDQRIVDLRRFQFLWAHRFAAVDSRRIGLAKGKVTEGIFVKKGIIKENADWEIGEW